MRPAAFIVDADAVLAIHQSGIDEGNATFETQLPSWQAFSAAKLPSHRFVTSESAGTWTIQSGIFPENIASLGLHQAAGFREIGVHEPIARHHGRWRDVVLVERRSPRYERLRASSRPPSQQIPRPGDRPDAS